MSDALRAEERLHNALMRLETLVEGKMEQSVQQVTSADDGALEMLKKENAKLKNAQEQAKLRLDTLISSIEVSI